MDDIDYAQKMSEDHLKTRISAAQAAIAHGSASGICEDCGEPIPVKRLQAAPWATRCIDCQIEHERNERDD